MRPLGLLLPDYYEEVREMQEIMQVETDALSHFQQEIKECVHQAFASTATWGMERWEQEFGITPDPNKPIEQRRSVIMSKIRGVGTVTVSLVQNVAQAYDRGAIEVTEQPSIYQLTIKFVDTLGTPPNLDDLKAAVEEMKPAHLAVLYAFKYLLINRLHEAMTIDELQASQLSDFSPVLPV